MKKSLALTLALIMVLCMLPMTALAANGTGHQISVKIYKVVLDSSKPLGYQTPELLVDTITVICQDKTSHSGYNHSVNLKEFYPTNFGLTTTDWTGWQFNAYYEKGKDKATFYDWTSEQVNATANVTGSEPYPCSKNFYLVYKEAAPQTQDITLTYDANGGTGAPEPQTQTVESGKEATFIVNSKEPTRANYDFKGWSTDRNAETASYHGGDSITISQDTTLYAVWANHEHKDENDDGYCDTDRECMHPKDNDRYCTVDGCTHPDTCCPKKPDNKPDKPNPEPSATPAIDGLTGVQVVEVECVTDGSKHEGGKYQLISGSYQVGAVQGDATNGYTCDITVYPGKYVEAYNTDIMVTHTLATAGQTGTITLRWKPDVGQDGTAKWIVDRGVSVVFKVVCAPVVDPSEPEKPSDDAVKTLLGDVVTIDCTNNKVTHEDKTYGLLPGGFSVGDVEGNKEDGYTVNVTVTPDAYVTQYSNDIGEKHNLSPDGQDNLIITLKCAGKGSEWEFVPFTTKTYTVVCETGVTDTVTVSFDSNGGTAVAPQTINKGEKATRPANPTMDGYTFVNWYLDGKVYDFNKPVDKDITLLAQWKKNDDNPGQNPYPDPSPKPNPGGHDHGNSTVVVPITVYMPPKTGDMPFWYSIAQFLGLVK